MNRFLFSSLNIIILTSLLSCTAVGSVRESAVIVPPNPETLRVCKTINTSEGRTVLRKLSNKAMSPGSSEQARQAHSGALLSALTKNTDRAQGLTLIMELQLVGKEEAVAGLAAQLKHGQLYKAAVRALVSIRSKKTAPAIDEVLTKAFLNAPTEKELIYTKAMSAIASSESPILKKLTRLTRSKNKEVPMAAYIALASSGHPSAFATLENGLNQYKKYKLGKLYTSVYDYLRRLSKTNKTLALTHLQKTITGAKAFKTKEGKSFLVAGLSALYDISGDDCVKPVLLPYLTGEDVKLRVGVTRFIKVKCSKKLQADFLKQLQNTNDLGKTAIFDILLDHQPTKVAPHLIKALSSKNSVLKESSVTLLAKVNETTYVNVLVNEFILKGDQSQWDTAFGLFERIKNLKHMQQLSDTYNKIDSPDLKIRIIKLFAKRGIKSQAGLIHAACNSSNKKIRKEAFKALSSCTASKNIASVIQLLLKVDGKIPSGPETGIASAIESSSNRESGLKQVRDALTKATGKNKSPFMGILARSGTTADRTLVVNEATQGSDVNTQKDAVKALAQSTDFATAASFVSIMKSNKNVSVRVLSIEGLFTLIVNNPRKKITAIEQLTEALKYAPRPEDKKRISQQIAKLRKKRK